MVTITNFRDIGGIKNKEGKEIVQKVFLRSGELSKLSIADKNHLEAIYHLRKIVDLRSSEEVAERPDQVVSKANYIHIDILKNIQDEGATIEDFVKIGSPEKSALYMKNLYASIALNQEAQQGYTHFFKEILTLSAHESLLFHCFAGKDRTGIAALLLLEALEVPKEAIYTDYLLTNKLRIEENALILKEAKKENLDEASLAALHVALNVDRSYLDNFYQSVENQYGNMLTYLTQAIGIDQGTKQELAHRFLVK